MMSTHITHSKALSICLCPVVEQGGKLHVLIAHVQITALCNNECHLQFAWCYLKRVNKDL